MYFVYALYSAEFDRLYVGQTTSLAHRVKAHNAGKVTSTKAFLPWEVVYWERCQSRSQALKREKQLKSHRGRDFIRGLVSGRVRRLPD